MSDREIINDLENVELLVGDDYYEASFTRVTRISHDPDYGADADGRRGMPMDFIDEDYYEDVFVSKYIEAEDKMTEAVALGTLPEAERQAVEAALEAYLDAHDAE